MRGVWPTSRSTAGRGGWCGTLVVCDEARAMRRVILAFVLWVPMIGHEPILAQMPGSVLHLRVESEEGRALSGIGVSLIHTDLGDSKQLVTGEDGEITTEFRGSGQISVVVDVPGYQRAVAVGLTGKPALRLVLKRTRPSTPAAIKVSGRVVDIGGRGIAGAVVSLQDPHSLGIVRQLHTGEGGDFTGELTACEEVVISATATTHRPGAIVVPCQKDTRVDVRLQVRTSGRGR
jgi:hypothetical protein